MKTVLIVLASILFIGVQSGRCISRKHVSMVIVTRLSAGRNANVEKGLVALNQYILGPRHLPATITVPLGTDAKTLGPFFVFKRADTSGVFWDQYGATVSRSDPRGYGHYVFEKSGSLLWKDVSLIVRRNNDSLLIYGAKNYIAVRISSTPGDREQDILPTLFKLCPLLQIRPRNGSAGAGRIYFYRGRETVGSAAPIGVSLNGIMIGYFLGGNSYFYIDVPAGNYEIGSRIDYHTEFQPANSIGLGSSGILGLHVVGFNHAMAFSLAAGKTKFIRLRVHFGLAHPKVKVSAANERSASSIIKHPQGPEINSGPTEQLGALQGPKTNQPISAPIAPAASLEAETKRIDAASTFYEPKGYRSAWIVATREADENAIIGILNGGDYFKATATSWRPLSAKEVSKIPKDIKKDLRMNPVNFLVWLVDVGSLRDPAFDTQYPSLLNNARRALFGTLSGSFILTLYPAATPADELKTNGNLDPSKLAYASLNYSLFSSAQRPSFATFPATVASARRESGDVAPAGGSSYPPALKQPKVIQASAKSSKPAPHAMPRTAVGQTRPTNTIATGAQALKDNGDGTVTDKKSGLIWQKDDDSGEKNWDDSVSYCRSLSLAGHSDWRLPSLDQLVSLWNGAGSKAETRKTYFPTMKSSEELYPGVIAPYWSATSNGGNVIPNGADFVSFNDGSVHVATKHFFGFYSRCVRRGK